MAEKYAPLVVLHDEEKLRPCSADWFIAHSSLRWATGAGIDGTECPMRTTGSTRADSAPRAGIRTASTDTRRARLTRPLDDNSARGGDPPIAQGFFLRLREEAFARGEQGTSSDPSVYAGVTAYWDYDPTAKAMTYWLFYAGSAPPLGILRMHEQIGLKARDAGGVAPDEAPPPELEAAAAAAYLEEFQQAYPGLALEVEPQVRREASETHSRASTSSSPGCRPCSATTRSSTRATGNA